MQSRLPAVHHARGFLSRERTLTLGEGHQLAGDAFTRAVLAPPKLRVQEDGGYPGFATSAQSSTNAP